MYENSPVIIDNGSGWIKVGVAGDDAPREVFQAIVGKPKSENLNYGPDAKQIYIGQQAQDKRGILKIIHPVQHGIVKDWENMSKLWHYCYQVVLKSTPSQQACFLTEPPLNPKQNRRKSAQVMFEQFDVPAFYLGVQPVLSLYFGGKTTGVVVDSGDSVTFVVSVNEGNAINNSILRNDLGGRDLTLYLKKLLQEAGRDFGSETQIVRDIKQNLCYVAGNFEAEVGSKRQIILDPNQRYYELPDGQTLKVESQKVKCPEALFQPKLLGKQLPGVHHLVNSSIQQCENNLKGHLLSNVVLSGGNTMFSGLKDRLQKEVSSLTGTSVNVQAHQTRKFLPWIGASIATTLSTFATKWITKAEFQEHGSQIVNKKCN